jgi:hypothetical protein
MAKSLVIYSYYQKNDEYVKNLEFFLKFGIYPDIDYIFCINGRECSITIPNLPNIKIIERDNIGFDFGAYYDALKTIDTKFYEYYFFINTSVRGPFLPDNIRSNVKWTQPFIELLKGDVKLVGTSINIFNIKNGTAQDYANHYITKYLVESGLGYNPPFPHVQSQMFLLNRESLNYLLSENFFNYSIDNDFSKTIALREILMSLLILKNGWNINCILNKYKNLEYRKIKDDINPTSSGGDAYYPGAYFGNSIKPYDVIFIKTNRGVSTKEIIELTDGYFIYDAHPTNYIEPFGNMNSPSNKYMNTSYSIPIIEPEFYELRLWHLVFILFIVFLVIVIVIYGYRYLYKKQTMNGGRSCACYGGRSNKKSISGGRSCACYGGGNKTK